MEVHSYAESQQALQAAVSHQILFACFCNAKGLLPTLNWASHAARAGIRPVVGIDGPAPQDLVSMSEWHKTGAVFFLLPPFEEAFAASTSPTLRRTRQRQASRMGFQFWLVRWYSVLQLLELGCDIMLSDSDVVWHRDPRPYLRAVSEAHPLLDVLIHSDHSVFAEDYRADLSYASVASPSRQQLLARYQTIRPLPNSSAAAASAMGTQPPADFDVDPQPAHGFNIGTWNPGTPYRPTPPTAAWTQPSVQCPPWAVS
jgi:hypothetical protein